MKKDIVKKINFLKARRHQDALRIKRLKRRLDDNPFITGAVIGLGLSTLINKFVTIPLVRKLTFRKILEGKYPEEEFVNEFKIYFNRGKYLFANFYEPDVWKNVGEGNYAIIAQKINAAQTVEQLARALPDSELLKKVYSAYKSAKASGLYV
jgi:hypothetical protein